ncbi:SprT family zinc-dependent metalloprotease [Amycolatopsis sp. NPDC051061]|uniref:M48 family metallopeptidase n=1 Tax=Amycolatopsis sp. NPDC051061 TaxID=3155042 RepID=UPI00341B17B4
MTPVASSSLPGRVRVSGLDFEVRVSATRSTFGITIERDGDVVLRAPADAELSTVEDWARARVGWVFRKLADKDRLVATQVTKRFLSGEGFDLLGRHYRLRLVEEPGIQLQDGWLRLPRGCAEDGRAAEKVIAWYRQEALRWLPTRIEPWAARMAARPRQLDVRDLGYRWGSLGKGDRLNLHWAIMQLPPSLIDYVIVHELAHVDEPNHTKGFWGAVRRVLPDYEQRKTRLSEAGTQLWLPVSTGGTSSRI